MPVPFQKERCSSAGKNRALCPPPCLFVDVALNTLFARKVCAHHQRHSITARLQGVREAGI
jgi:hypothetical protein